MNNTKIVLAFLMLICMGLSLPTTSQALQARVFRDLTVLVPGLELSHREWEFYLKPLTSFTRRPDSCWELVQFDLKSPTIQAPSLDAEHAIVMPNLLYLGDNYFTRLGFNSTRNVLVDNCWYPSDTFFEVVYSRKNRWDFGGARSLSKPQAAERMHSELEPFVTGLNTAAFSLYQQMADRQEPDNIFFSPYNVLQTLAMIYAGARNQTAAQMEAAFPFLLFRHDPDDPHESFNRLNYELEGRSEGECGPYATAPKCPAGFRLNVANAFWVVRSPAHQPELQGNAFVQDYLDTLATHYGEGLRFLNLTGTSSEEREAISQQINYWGQLFTQQDIQQVITPDQIDPDINLMLTSAMYFNASWKKPFLRGLTDYAEFHNLNGSRARVSMMRQRNTFRQYKEADYDALELMYAGDQLAMLIVVPLDRHFQQVEARFNYALVQTILNKMGEEQTTDLFLPRWDLSSRIDLTEALRSLGLTDLTTAGVADLSGIHQTHNLALGLVSHSATVTVNEDGTRAAAATDAENLGEQHQISLLEIKRPFIYIIRDVPTETILFMGRVVTL